LLRPRRLFPGLNAWYRFGVANEEKGITAGGHTPMFDCDEESIKTGVQALATAVCDRLDAK
jgi:metal-dependent amidase/aminoacylase/carboxypeptidase family protein